VHETTIKTLGIPNSVVQKAMGFTANSAQLQTMKTVFYVLCSTDAKVTHVQLTPMASSGYFVPTLTSACFEPFQVIGDGVSNRIEICFPGVHGE